MQTKATCFLCVENGLLLSYFPELESAFGQNNQSQEVVIYEKAE